MAHVSVWKSFLVCLVFVGCAPKLETPQDRRDYLRSMVDDDLRKSFGCAEVGLRLERTEQRSGDWYDYYFASGCGHRSAYVTRTSLTNQGTFITWAFATVPGPDEYRAAAEQQLTKRAQFDLTCESAITFTHLKDAYDPMFASYATTLGARGCDKQNSYEITCAGAGFVNGKHDINCVTQSSEAVR